MDTTTGPKGPPAAAAAFFEVITPHEFRAALKLRLSQNYTTFPRYCLDAVRFIRATTVVSARKAFNVRRHLGDVLAIFIGFSTAPIGTLAAVLAVSIPVLILWDGHADPKDPSPGAAAADGLILGVTLLLALPFLFPSSLAIGWRGLFIATAISVFIVTCWRTMFRMKDPPRLPVIKDYDSAWLVTALWIVGGVAVAEANGLLADWHSAVLDVIADIPPIIFAVALNLDSDSIGSFWGPQVKGSLNTDPVVADLYAKKGRLFYIAGKVMAGLWTPQFFERLCFVLLAIPTLAVVVESALGYIPPDGVNWMLLCANACAYVILCKTWVDIKKINMRVAAALQKEIDARKAKRSAA